LGFGFRAGCRSRENQAGEGRRPTTFGCVPDKQASASASETRSFLLLLLLLFLLSRTRLAAASLPPGRRASCTTPVAPLWGGGIRKLVSFGIESLFQQGVWCRTA
jgi:hypothetical protein